MATVKSKNLAADKSKKTLVKVRDLKPSKDAKGGVTPVKDHELTHTVQQGKG